MIAGGQVGKEAEVLGMPGQKEWQEIEFMPGVHMSERRLARTLLNRAVVRFVPLGKRKTGREGTA